MESLNGTACQSPTVDAPTLTFAFSPCPNDTFAFHALVHGLVGAPFQVQPVLLDIEELNRHGRRGTYDLTKLSFGVIPAVRDAYRMLGSGAALGRGAGPLVVARRTMTLDEAAAGRIAIPGRDTTAFLLLSRAASSLGDVVEMRYDRILDAVVRGEVDAGLIIHESRFTYTEHGLKRVSDLGEWWETRDRPANATGGDLRTTGHRPGPRGGGGTGDSTLRRVRLCTSFRQPAVDSRARAGGVG